MKTSFLGQGFEDKSPDAIGNYLMKFLTEDRFHSFVGLSAFASEAGIFGLSKYLNLAKNHFQTLSLVVGIDQGGTSKEALEEVLSLNINSYIFYQKEQPIFHPKIYLFEGVKNITVLIGSSNLTASGLFTNVESSLLVEFNVGDKEGETLVAQLKGYYKSLFDFTDPNLHKITKENILKFLNEGLIPNEESRREVYSKRNPPVNSQGDSPFSIKKRATSKIPSSFPQKLRGSKVSMKPVLAAEPEPTLAKVNPSIEKPALGVPHLPVTADSDAPRERQVWQSGPLTERDLNVPKGPNTNITGSMLFKKGLNEGIDQRHYFRDEVFSSLPWAHDIKPSTAHLERATAFFKLIILGEDKGIFPLALTHNTKTDTKSYKQSNSMTSISWGKAKELIAKDELIGKSAILFKDDSKTNEYTLVIE